MTDVQLADLSRVLFSPVTLILYVAAMLLYLWAMATRVDRQTGAADPDVTATAHGRQARRAGLALTLAGLATHVAHIVTRSLAAGRWPLGNMFEFTTMMALVVVAGGLVYLQLVRRRPDLMGFVLLGGSLTLASALLVYNDPGPLMPILDTYWRAIHVSTIVLAAGIFTVGFVFNGLHLLRDTAEQRVAAAQDVGVRGSTVGAAYVGAVDVAEEEAAVPGRASPDALAEVAIAPDDQAAYRLALRRSINPWKLATATWLVTAAALSWVFVVNQPLTDGLVRFVTVNTALAAAALVGWWFVGAVPPAATLDSITYRVVAFGFPIWTFAVIAGAIWAEVSWGRYWGWDPKETSAFLTWVAYAGYLHARATRGLRGRGASWIGIAAFGVLLFTYYAVNLVVTGLHSYAGLQ